MQWQTQFNNLRGHALTLHGQPLELVKYVEQEGQVEFVTTLDEYAMPVTEAAQWLSQLLPVESRPARRAAAGLQPSAIFSDNSALQTMQQALLSSLERVQKDKSYIPQAQQVSSLVQVGINLARVELAVYQLAQKAK